MQKVRVRPNPHHSHRRNVDRRRVHLKVAPRVVVVIEKTEPPHRITVVQTTINRRRRCRWRFLLRLRQKRMIHGQSRPDNGQERHLRVHPRHHRHIIIQAVVATTEKDTTKSY